MGTRMQTTRVPSHLQHFHRPRITTEPTSIGSFHSGGRLNDESFEHHELCPPRWRLKPKPNLRSTLKAIICKDWQSLISQSRPPPTTRTLRAKTLPVRMKDRDDYITMRAANPRTGIISPTVSTQTPRTPKSPGDALKLHSVEQASPSLMRKGIRTYSQPDGKQTICVNNEQRQEQGREQSQEEDQSSVKQADIQYRTAITSPSYVYEACRSNDDQFVVHMPSAHEPLVTYPGYTADQVAALEHYQHKSRRVSGEGFDRRLPSGSGNPCVAQVETEQGTAPHKPGFVPRPTANQHFKPYRHDIIRASSKPPSVVVRKRSARVEKTAQGNVIFAPTVHALKAAAASGSIVLGDAKAWPVDKAVEQNLRIINPVPLSGEASKHAKTTLAQAEISRQEVHSLPRRWSIGKLLKRSANGDHYLPGKCKALPRLDLPIDHNSEPQPAPSDVVDLSRLPRVKLVRPEHAGLPETHELRREHDDDDDDKRCSLGCAAGADSACSERRITSTGSVVHHLPLFECHPQSGTIHGCISICELAKALLWSVLTYLGGIQLPRTDVLEVLRSPEVPVEDKLAAMKAVLALTGHAIAVGTALATLVQLGRVLATFVEVLVSPFSIPVLILRWLFGAR